MKTNKFISPFISCVVQNFPFIEESIDGLTQYQLLCKIVEKLKAVITQTNTQTENIEKLEEAFTTLKNYVDNYFNNLDVQTEINNKLDEMATSGELEAIIASYLNGIVVSGSNENGNWIKYNDGTMICAISKEVSFADYSQDGTIYYYDINNINFPQSFTQLNSVNASFNSTKPGKFPWTGIYNATTSSIARIRLLNYYNANDNAGYINIIAIGKWK